MKFTEFSLSVSFFLPCETQMAMSASWVLWRTAVFGSAGCLWGSPMTLSGDTLLPMSRIRNACQKALTYWVLFDLHASPAHTHCNATDNLSGLQVFFCYLFGNIIEKNLFVFWMYLSSLASILYIYIPEAVKELILFQCSRCLQHLDFGNILRTVSLSNESERYALCLTGPLSPEETLLPDCIPPCSTGWEMFSFRLTLFSTFSSNCSWYPSS